MIIEFDRYGFPFRRPAIIFALYFVIQYEKSCFIVLLSRRLFEEIEIYANSIISNWLEDMGMGL